MIQTRSGSKGKVITALLDEIVDRSRPLLNTLPLILLHFLKQRIVIISLKQCTRHGSDGQHKTTRNQSERSLPSGHNPSLRGLTAPLPASRNAAAAAPGAFAS